MRNAWIAIATIVLIVGASVAVGIGWSGRAERVTAPLEDSPKPPVPESRREDDALEAPATKSPNLADVPAGLEIGPLPRAPLSTADVVQTTSPPASPPVPPPVPAPVPAPVPTPIPARALANASRQEPDRSAESPAAADDPESDRRPPVLHRLRFDPPEIKDGGKATLHLGVTDELSGVKAVYGSLRSPSGAALVPFSARDLDGGGFSATIAIPSRGETGDWFVATIQVIDRAENALALSFVRATVPEGGALRVASDESDSLPPTVHGITVVRASVDAGERNQIVVDIDDDRSGVAQVTGAFQSPSKSAFIPFACTKDGESPSWVGDVRIPENADCGEWTLRQLRVVDKANNSAFLSTDAPQVGRVNFLVSGGGECDAEPPVVDALYFSPAFVSNALAAEVVVTVRAHDAQSGVASLSGWIEGPVAVGGKAPRIYFECVPDPNDNGGGMTKKIVVPQFAAKGTWRVVQAQVADKARNTRSYNRADPALRDASFTVD